MMQLSREERMIKLDKMSNTRDLGGYETQEGHYTRSHVFVRAANPSTATSLDLKRLYDYGVRCQVDLRSVTEMERQPSQLKDYEGIDYYAMPLMQNTQLSVLPKDMSSYNDLSGFYIFVLEAYKEQFKAVFKVFLKYAGSTVLFNCSAGKDRTGIIAALLLDLVGCHEYDIVKDYTESYENNAHINEELEKMLGSDTAHFLYSEPRYMMKMINHIRDTYGSSKEYLLSTGLSEDELDEIKENFII